MNQPLPVANASRAVRVIHVALVIGLALAGAVLYVVRRASPPLSVGAAPSLAIIVAAIAAITLIMAVLVLRPRVPARRPDQDGDAYWKAALGPAIVLWGAVEGTGLMGAVGYFVTGGTLPLAAFVLGVATLAVVGPGRLEGEGQ